MIERMRKAPLEALQEEIRGEMAASLGRVARELEQRLEALATLGAAIASEAEAGERGGKQADYRRLLAEAKEYRWYLMVQREALGLRNHDVLMRLYPLPTERR